MPASSPPAPALISRNAEPSSAESLGNNINFNSCSNLSGLSNDSFNSSSARLFRSSSPDSRISFASFIAARTELYSSNLSTIGFKSANSLLSRV